MTGILLPDGTVSESPVPLVGIFADDLTGALDAAAPFSARGFRTVVSPGVELPAGAIRAEVISLNLSTRHADSNRIAHRVSAAVKLLSGLGVKVLLNKVDSTLRGYPGVELAAALNTIEGDHAVLCPAYPQNGRIVENGVLFVDGEPVAETDIGRDRLSPLPSSRVDEIVMSALMRAGVEDRVHVRGPEGGVAIDDFLPVVITPDARSERDLQVLCERIVSSESQTLVGGSAGIAVALADQLGADRLIRRNAPDEAESGGRRFFVVTASQRSIVDDQIATLNEQMDIVQAELSIDEAIEGVNAESIEKMVEVCSTDGIVVFKLASLNAQEDHDVAGLQNMAEKITRNIGSAVHEIADQSHPDTLVLIGGDTASGVLDACGVTALDLRGELQPGTVVSRPIDGTIAGSLLLTRAGGFGDENALFELVRLLEFGHNV